MAFMRIEFLKSEFIGLTEPRPFCLGGFKRVVAPSKTPKPPATDPETCLQIQLTSRRRS